jgi:hypothetical protein
MGDVVGIQKGVTPAAGLKSINVISFDDWLKLSVFADHAINFNATNETQLRILAKMGANDPIPRTPRLPGYPY